jgi:hypothetical protein
MENKTEGLYPNITLNDVQLAAAYYPILIDLAKHKHCLTYGELVDRAKEEHPKKEVVQNAIAVSAGRKLDVVRLFTSERKLPDVTSLIINKNEGDCGSLYTAHFDPKKAREEVFKYDWKDVSTEFDLYIESAEKNATPRKRRTRDASLKLMSDHYSQNKSVYPLSIKDKREEIIILLMEGFDVEDCFIEEGGQVFDL